MILSTNTYISFFLIPHFQNHREEQLQEMKINMGITNLLLTFTYLYMLDNWIIKGILINYVIVIYLANALQ